MPKTIDDADLQAAADAMEQHGTPTAAAAALGIPRTTFIHRLKLAQNGGIKAHTPADALTQRINALERDNTLLRDKASALTIKLKHQHRADGLYDALCDEMLKIIAPLSPLPKAKTIKSKTEHTESLVLHISDEHADQIVEPHRVGGLESYNFKVALARAERLVDKTLSIVKNTLSNYDFPELWILAYGDHVNGEIHDSTNHSEFRNAFDNAIACGQMHALMIRPGTLFPCYQSALFIWKSR
jgi:hypothetical protein